MTARIRSPPQAPTRVAHHGLKVSAARRALPSASLERVLFQEGLEVLARGLDLLFGQPDDQRLGELEKAAAICPAAERQPGARARWLKHLVDLQMERPPRCRRGELLVLGEPRARYRRLIPPAQERAHIH